MSTSKKAHILVADDDHNILAALKLLLVCDGYEVTLASHPEQVTKIFEKESIDCVCLDLNFKLDTTSGEEGLALIKALNQIDESVPIVVMTGWATIDIAVSTMQNGAADFIQKPWENERVLKVIDTQIKLAKELHQSAKLNRENEILKQEQHQFNAFIAESASMQSVLKMAEQVAKSDINVLITGDNGTGKSLLAEHIHTLSARAKQSLVNVNMGAISENLFESEMFGHVKGAFTDARETRIGRFELADGGSLFLDEIGNIPLSQQSKLLRVLESSQFEKVGASKTQHADTRIISATNANIEQLIEAGHFRQDLFYRLNSVEIRLPPLRERVDDILPMANYFLNIFINKYNKPKMVFSDTAISALKQYHWPGNIRELNHMIERAIVLTSNQIIDVEQLAIVNTSNDNQTIISEVDENEFDQPLEALEKGIIQRRIQHCGGNMINTAKSLGLSRSSFYRRIDKHNL